MKSNKISFGKIGLSLAAKSSPQESKAPPDASTPSEDTQVVPQVVGGGFGVFGRTMADETVNAGPAAIVSAGTDDTVAAGTADTVAAGAADTVAAGLADATAARPEVEPPLDETLAVSQAMGFVGFGKKARTFDLDKLAEQSRKEAAERNRKNIEKLSLEASNKNRLDSKESEEDDDGNEEVIGPPLPPDTQNDSGCSDGDDDELVGPPLPPHMRLQQTTADAALGEESDSGDESHDGFKLPVSHELMLGHGSKAVTTVAMDPSGSRLVSGSIDYDVKYWDFQGMDISKEAFRSFCPHDGYPVQAVHYSCTGDKVLVVSGASQAKVYDRDGIELFECAKGDMYLQDMGKTKGHVSGITDACFHPKDKEEFLTSSRDGTCRIWMSSKPSCQKHVIKARAVSGLKAKPTACCYSRDGLIVACAADDGSIQMWDHRKSFVNTIINVRDCHTKSTDTSSICFSYDNKYYCSRGIDDTLKLWDIRKPKSAVFSATGLFNRFDMTSCLFSPNDQFVVTGTSMNKGDTSGKLVMFNRNTWKLEHHMSIGESHVVSLVWHPRLNQICVGAGDGSIRLLYDPSLSRNGAVLAAGKRKKRHKESGVVVSQQIITPHALPMFREERHKSTRKLELRDRKDPVKSRRPDLPLGKAGTGGRVTAGGSTLSSYIIRNLGLQNKLATEDEGDPREALLKYAELAKEDPYWVSPAYSVTQPKPLFREPEDDDIQQKSKKQKME